MWAREEEGRPQALRPEGLAGLFATPSCEGAGGPTGGTGGGWGTDTVETVWEISQALTVSLQTPGQAQG